MLTPSNSTLPSPGKHGITNGCSDVARWLARVGGSDYECPGKKGDLTVCASVVGHGKEEPEWPSSV